MSNVSSSEAAKAVARRNTEEVHGKGRFDVFDELFADDFIDHTPQPNTTPDKAGVRKLYMYIRAAFPDFHAEIHWQLVHFETVDVMRVQNSRITDHWGVGNVLSLMRQIGGWTQPAEGAGDSTVSSLNAR